MSPGPSLASVFGHRLTVICGPFGVGKTEIALNLSMTLAAEGCEPRLIDLDVVTPYFRPRDVAAALTRAGVHVVCPEGDVAFTDLPAVPGHLPALLGAGARGEATVVVDLGGGAQGALVLASLRSASDADGRLGALCVVNPYRPDSASADALGRVIGEIEGATGAQVTGLIANPNLKLATTPATIERGNAAILSISQALGLPIVAQCRAESLPTGVDCPWAVPTISLQLMMLLPFEADQARVR